MFNEMYKTNPIHIGQKNFTYGVENRRFQHMDTYHEVNDHFTKIVITPSGCEM